MVSIDVIAHYFVAATCLKHVAMEKINKHYSFFMETIINEKLKPLF
jgi:hypothetical protein